MPPGVIGEMAVADHDGRPTDEGESEAEADPGGEGDDAAGSAVTIPPRLERTVHEFVAENGRPPLAVEAVERIDRSRVTIARYGDWSDILAGCGVPTIEETVERWLLDYIDRTYGDDVSLNASQIADDLEMSPAAVGRALSRLSDGSDRVDVRPHRGSKTTRWFISRKPSSSGTPPAKTEAGARNEAGIANGSGDGNGGDGA